MKTEKDQGQPKKRVRVAVAGARGYSGLELAKLLLKHPSAELVACFATSAFQLSEELYGLTARSAAGQLAKFTPGLPTSELLPMARAKNFNVVFLATPAPISMELAPRLIELGIDVIDLSGAFRLQDGSSDEIRATYNQWYGLDHQADAHVQMAQFGLVPWVSERPVAKTNKGHLVANPGCFSTAVLMAILPLLKYGILDPESLVIDAKSGTTGAGKKAEERLLHAEVDGACSPYRIGRHQHLPEICQFVKAYAGVNIDPQFTTHLLGIRRGILAGIYGKRLPQSDLALADAYARAYSEDPLVDVIALDSKNETSALNLRRVVGTARTRIAFREEPKTGPSSRNHIYVFSMIDNLLKGAASQAIENFNRIIGLPASTTLTEMEGVL